MPSAYPLTCGIRRKDICTSYRCRPTLVLKEHKNIITLVTKQSVVLSSTIRRKVGNESVIMRTEYRNTVCPGSLHLPSMCRIQRKAIIKYIGKKYLPPTVNRTHIDLEPNIIPLYHYLIKNYKTQYKRLVKLKWQSTDIAITKNITSRSQRVPSRPTALMDNDIIEKWR